LRGYTILFYLCLECRIFYWEGVIFVFALFREVEKKKMFHWEGRIFVFFFCSLDRTFLIFSLLRRVEYLFLSFIQWV
jgi:hypothetical protein